MATGTTLLSYEMAWQLKYFELMTNSQQANDYVMACVYGEALLRFVGLKDKVPQKEIPAQGSGTSEVRAFQKHFQALLIAITDKIAQTITDVRGNYQKDKIVPGYSKPKEKRTDG